MNRLEDYFRTPDVPERPVDFYIVESHYDTFVVSYEMALDLERQLDQLPSPRWVALRDLAGARHRVLAAQVYRISESTAEQRAARRAFNRARQKEDKEEDHRRPWERDD